MTHLITYTDSATKDIIFNYQRALYSECLRRVFPILRDTNTIKLTDGTNNLTLTSTTIGGKSIANLMTSNNLTMDYINYVGILDYSGSPATHTMNSLFSSFIIDITVTSGDSGTGQHILYLPTLSNSQFVHIQISGAMQTYNLQIQD